LHLDENIAASWVWLNSGESDDFRTNVFRTGTKCKSHGINIFSSGLVGHHFRDITRNEAGCIGYL